METASRTKVVPLISSDTAGPLGAIHLPRLWAKLTLGNAGLLADGYDMCGSGFDQMTIDGLGLDRQKVVDYVKNRKPTYMQFEEWVVEQNGGNIPKEKIEKHNAAIRGYNHSDELGANMRRASGIKRDDVKDAVRLNSLEDLDELHRQATTASGNGVRP
ncbi:MAG: DUF5069 domain-containing protein [Candidatus Eremiobacteraeota bacterium]|nr:DUF5069 domain-containing protein [Candidatus Eremiobacteraeota bacterium]MBV9648036.1 DUF5069 domain-containing protein [Candidatus Eremiobacteraeota bacterium]